MRASNHRRPGPVREGVKAMLLMAGGFAMLALGLATMLHGAAAYPQAVAAPGDVVAVAALERLSSPVAAMRVASVWAGTGPACALDMTGLAARAAVLTVAAVRADAVVLRIPAGAGCGAAGLAAISAVDYQRLTLGEPPRAG
jgi:hypothetical protein